MTTPAFTPLKYFLIATAVVAHAIAAESTSRSPVVPSLNIERFSSVFVVTSIPENIIKAIPMKSNFVNLSVFRAKNPIKIMKIGCRCPMITAFITGTCVNAKKYIKSAKRVPITAM